MKHSQETFLQLVKEAYDGTLQLPAFQREWKWERNKVISLYDSLRKRFPIGSFLFLDASSEYDLSPRPYEGSSAKFGPVRLTLDGQQRITSGVILVHGVQEAPRYFLDLNAIKNFTEEHHIDYRNDEQVKKFVQDIDDGDNYMIATTRKTELNTLLLQDHLLVSTHLDSKISLQKALEPYEKKYPQTKDLLKYVVVPYFTLDNESNCPVTTLTSSESLSAVTKIFATINTTGKTLTPIEIVTAILYSRDINLKQKVNEYHEASDYLTNMDSDGEVLLQTIALLADQPPKKSMLPKTITYERFKAFCEDALDLLDRVGEFLAKELGVGLKDTKSLIPYNSILAPMAVCFKEIKGLEGGERSKALEKIKTWFIGATLGQRYIQGVGSKQETDTRDIKEWIRKDKSELKPTWLNSVHISIEMIKKASPNGSTGKLIKCLINREKPNDPLELTKIGYYDDADEPPEDHHIWPKKFCTQHISDWDKNHDSTEYALNMIPVAPKTNRKWTNMDPNNQMNDVKTKIPNEAKRKDIFEKLLLSDECVQILERPNKTKKDYLDFLDARFNILSNKLAVYGFTLGEEEYEDDVTNE